MRPRPAAEASLPTVDSAPRSSTAFPPLSFQDFDADRLVRGVAIVREIFASDPLNTFVIREDEPGIEVTNKQPARHANVKPSPRCAHR